MAALRAVCYINQFYAGIGGEEMAHVGLNVYSEKKGPAMGMEGMWKGEMEVVKVLSCGDNFINTDEKFEGIKEELKREILEAKPDVFVAGPAFNAGRYGVACAKMCDFVKKELGIPSVTGMWWENPAVQMYVQDNYIISTTETASGMRKSLPAVAALALKLATREELDTITQYAFRINGILKAFWQECGVILVDFKLEFGRLPDGAIVLADEISPDTCRLWDSKTHEKLDKDRFRRDLGGAEEAYEEVMRRLTGVE